jgi:hypothetical protein
MADITVTRTGDTTFRVAVTDNGSTTTHDVTLTDAIAARYAPGRPAETLVEASFEFLLEREPKESILREFDLPVIERYFPEYPRKIAEMLENR